MSELMRLDEEYRSWIQELGERYRKSQIKASIRVNNEMLMYYWSVGKDITEKRADSKWGSKFFKNMSMDMSDIIPNAKGFSPTNLRYMMRFYGLFKNIETVPQVGERFLENSDNKIVHQVEEQFEMASNNVFMIPWGHIKVLIDKCHDNPKKFNFYINKVIENNWSRAVLLNFLMELGTGFAFVGREYRLQIGNTEQYVDMLFYNIKRHCYVVVEVKIVEFEPGFISQTATYVSAVNHTLKGKGDTQTIGLLICKTKDNILAKYAVETSTEPIGISEYELNALMPKDFKGTLPTIEELEQGLSENTVN